jgi:hypothetical protein
MHEVLQSSHSTVSPPEFFEHITDCSLCRGAVVLLTPQVVDFSTAEAAAYDHDSELDLAAFIDYEQQAGIVAAMRAYPHVWVDLLHNADLAETYQVTRALLDAEHRAELQPMAHVAASSCMPMAHDTVSMRLKRSFFNQTFLELPPTMGLARGAGADERVLLEPGSEVGMHMSLSLQQRSAAAWDITITMTPPVRGRLVLMLGEDVFRAPFDMYGIAVVPAVSAHVLTAPDGPDLVVGLEPAEE